MIPIGETIGSLSSLLCLSLLHFLWQAVAIALATVVAGLVLRRRSAQAEYIALVVGLALFPAAFAATLVWQATRLPPVTEPMTMRLPATAAAPTSAQPELESRLNQPIVPAESEPTAKVRPASDAARAVPAAWDWRPVAPWLGAVYLFGVLAMCIRLLIGLGGARRLCGAADRVEDQGVLESLARQCRRVGLRLAPPIAYCRDVSVPTLVGILRPTILLPLSTVAGLLPAELESILLHELVHIRRYDHLLNLSQRLVEAAFFFHPAVWFLSRRITVVREHCCDDEVLTLGAQRAVYIESLMRVAELSIATSSLGRKAAGLHATDKPSRLRQRIARLLDPPGRTTLRLKPAALLFIGALLVGSLTTPLLLTALACPRQHRDQSVAAISDSPPTDNKNATPKTPPAQPLHFSGIVVDKFTQKPIAGASVTVHRLEEGKHVEIEYGHSQWKNEELGKPEDIVTDANGRYEFTITAEQVADPRFQLATEVRHPHYLHPLPNWEHASISSILADIKEGKHPWLEKIELLPTRTVSGVIVDPTGHPLPSCEVMLISKKRRKPVLSDGSKALTWSETNKNLVDNAWDTANTDVQGRFNLQAVQGAELAKIWAEPKDFAVLEREIDPVVAQLGTLKLDTGARVAGTVVDEHEKPLVGVSVGCFPLEERNWHAFRTPRGAVTTDERGQFSLAPVAFGKYQVGVGDRRFVPIQVELSPDNPLAPITFRPHPLATVRVSFVDRAGKPSALVHPEIAISGSMAKVPYVGRLRRSLGHADGEVPIGLEDSVLEGIGISDYLVSWRLGDREKLQPAGYSPEGVKLGAINGPTEITVVETKLPRLLVQAIGPDGKPVMKFLPRIDYKDPALTRHAAPFKNGVKGDVLMIESTTLVDSQPKPGQWFSFRLLFDQEFTVTAEAAGYQPASQSLKMAEGETREITLTLAAETKKSSIIAPIKADTAMADKAPSPAGKVGGAAVVKHIYFQPPANETATKGAMRIHVVGTDGRRIAAVKIRAYVSTKEKDFNGSREYVCDDNGSVDVKLPGKLYTLRLFAMAAGYAPLSAHWESERPAAPTILPDEFTFSMKKGTVIGGFVKNDDDQPISGAKVWVRAIDFSDPHEVGRYDVALSEGSDAVTTDAQGHWSLNNVPPRGRSVLIGFTHPDYISDRAWGESQEKQHVATEAFLDQTAIIKMHRGTSVTGMITNSEGKPISGALVIRSDDSYISLLSQGDMETDKNGVYRVPPLPTGAIKLTVVAPGCMPQLRDLEIKPGMGPVDFQLKPGRTLRMKFVDKSGKPVPHVGVTVDKWRDGTSLCNIFHPDAHIPTHADASGIYEWSGAPDDPMSCMLFQKDLWSVGGVAVTADDREHKWIVPSSSDGYETLAAETNPGADARPGHGTESATAPKDANPPKGASDAAGSPAAQTSGDAKPKNETIAKPPVLPGSGKTRFGSPENETSTKGTIRIHVVDADGRAIPAAKIHAGVWTVKMDFKHDADYTCDANGNVDVELPKKLYILRLWAKKDSYAPMFAHWESWMPADQRVIPDEFTFPMKKGVVIGGVINNEDGQPISGAKVEVMCEVEVMYESDHRDELNGLSYSLWLSEGADAVKTDAQGRWSLNNVPPDDKDDKTDRIKTEVRIKLIHPDYVSDFGWGDSQQKQSVTADSLRAKTACIVMHRGTRVTGTITNADGKPISGALVIWGDDPYGDHLPQQEVLTDKNGVYQLPPLPKAMTVTVVAPGWMPQLRKTEIKSGMVPVDFQLKPGKTLRIKFVDSSGNAVPNVGVGIHGWRGIQSLYNYKHPNVLDSHIPGRADANGIYEWTWAPDDAVTYGFGTEHLQVSGITITADDQEHMQVMPSSRK